MMPQKFIDTRTYRLLQVTMNLAFLLVWYLSNDGLAFWDDFTYLNFAHQINEGTFQITDNHFTSRVGILYPVAWGIRAFGISEFTITLFPFICGLIILNLFFWLGHLYGHWIGLITSFLLLVDYHTITFMTHLFPEVPMALSIFGALLCYDFVNRREGDYRLLGLLMVLLLFGGFLVKTSIFIVVPLFAFLMVNDFLRGRNKGFWYISLFLIIFFLLIYGFWYKEMFGDFFYRFKNISDNHEPTVKTFFDKEQVDILKRLTYLPLIGFLRGGFFIPLGFAIPALLTLKKRDWALNKPEKLWAVSTVWILVSWWFISTNWKYYSPMPVDTRHITFLIPIMLMAGAFFWSDHKWFIKVRGSWLKWGIAGLFLIIPMYKIVVSSDKNFSSLEGYIKSSFVENDQADRIFTDGLISYGSPYFYGFEVTEDRYIWFSEMGDETIQLEDYLLVNPPYLNERYSDNTNLEQFKSEVEKRGWKLESVSVSQTSIQVYRIVQ